MNALPFPGFPKQSFGKRASVFEPAPSAKLRVGVVLSQFRAERWFARVLQQLSESGYALNPVVILDKTRPSEVKSSRLSALFSAFRKFDRNLNSRPTDALAPCDLTSALRGCRVLEANDDATAQALRAANLDVILAPDRTFAARYSQFARYGAWFFSDQQDLAASMFWAAYRHDPAYAITLQSVQRDGSPRVIYSSYSPTNEVSFHLGHAQSCWKASDILVRSLQKVQRTGILDTVTAPVVHHEYPSNLPTARYLMRWAGDAVVHKFNKRFRKEHWFIAYRPNNGTIPFFQADMNGFRVITPPRDRFYADPFVFENNGKNYIFFEDYRYSLKRGLISYLEIDENLDHSDPQVILDLPYHLSYPSVLKHEGEIFLVPETSGNNTVELYRALDFPRKWTLEKVLLPNVPAVDPTIFTHDGRFWMFVGGMVENASPNDELFLYWADSLLGEWHPHPRNPVISDVRNARPAGQVFVHNGQLLRPSQCWGRWYGAAVSMNRINVLSDTDYSEVPIGKIAPEWYPGNMGTHTFNQNRSLQVVDGRTRIFG